ncbi:MAG: hypothetical protein ACD_50C00184G0005 [uncultured bacterium]|nr:MAG: hypothetical protein ACD_50C00184G0005 [uncultured bacterium]
MSDSGFERFKELLANGIIRLNTDNASRSILVSADEASLNSALLDIWNGAYDRSEVNNGSTRRIGF